MFTERKISAFQTRISDLPDTPALSAAALKARFDACPEQLRQALNGICDDGAALEERMDSYQAQTFTGEISESMLNNALAAKLNAKADQSALQTVQASVTALQTALAQKCAIKAGVYTGDGEDSQTITLGFTPKAVFALEGGYRLNYSNESYGGLAVSGSPAAYINDQERIYPLIEIVTNGFTVYNSSSSYRANKLGTRYHYLAFQ